jgi:hypothetical protein
MTIIRFAKSALFLTLCIPTFALTIQSPTCEIEGDPDIYGIGIRCSFYLQWASVVILLFFAPEKGNGSRTACSITTLAIYINTFRNMHQGSLVAIDFPILWYLTSSLTIYNWPVSVKGFKKNGGSMGVVLLIWVMYYLAGPWVFFDGIQIGRQPGCGVKYFLFVPISIYSKGFLTFLKVSSIFGAIAAVGLLGLAIFLIVLWIVNWGDLEVQNFSEPQNGVSMFLGYLQLVSGPITIAFTEMTLKSNHITFPNTSITDSGQLIPLIIGLFTFATSLFSIAQAAYTPNEY